MFLNDLDNNYLMRVSSNSLNGGWLEHNVSVACSILEISLKKSIRFGKGG